MSNNALSASLQRLQESSLVPIIQDKPGYNRPTSIADAISRGGKTILSVQKERGLQPLVGWVKGRLIELFTYLGAFDIASEYQIQVLATRICTKFYYWTIQELDFAFLAFADGRVHVVFEESGHYPTASFFSPHTRRALSLRMDAGIRSDA